VFLKARWFKIRVWRTSMGAYQIHELSAGVGVEWVLALLWTRDVPVAKTSPDI
jgi:hypothetical protein